MSSGNRPSQRVVGYPETETTADHSGARQETDARATELTIGMYYRKAGTRDAGGIVMYVQELLDALAAHQSAYLYTESGELTPKMRSTDAEIVQLGDVPFESVSNHVLPSLSEKLIPLLGAARDGTIRRMNDTLDVLVTHDFLEDIVLSNLLDIPVVRVYHGFERTGLGTTAHGLLSESHSVVNSVQTSAEFVEQIGGANRTASSTPVSIPTCLIPTRRPPLSARRRTALFVERSVE